MILGLILGCFQDMLSAGELWINVVTKGGAGFLAGMAGRHMAHITPAVLTVGLVVISCLSSGVFLYAMNPASIDDVWMGVRSTVLVQAGYDAAIGAGLYLMFRRRWSDDRMVTEGAL